jgi:hypothetical protein
MLFDENGNLVATENGNASDGRNSVITYKVPKGGAGVWTIEVTSGNSTQGEYGLLATGATGALAKFTVASTDPAKGALVQPPTDIIVTFSSAVLGTSLVPDELEVNGVAATAVTLVNANTVDWTVPLSAYLTGTNLPSTVTIGTDGDGNEVTDVSGQTLSPNPFSYKFNTTNIPPAVITSSINGKAFSPAPASVSEVVTFSQPMNTSYTTASSFFYLECQRQGPHNQLHRPARRHLHAHSVRQWVPELSRHQPGRQLYCQLRRQVGHGDLWRDIQASAAIGRPDLYRHRHACALDFDRCRFSNC